LPLVLIGCLIQVFRENRAQLAQVERRLKEFGCGGVEVHTVDRFQGRDKHVIILSLVRSNASNDVPPHPPTAHSSP
jgi:superfamily I DNA and/or RNA helicase